MVLKRNLFEFNLTPFFDHVVLLKIHCTQDLVLGDKIYLFVGGSEVCKSILLTYLSLVQIWLLGFRCLVRNSLPLILFLHAVLDFLYLPNLKHLLFKSSIHVATRHILLLRTLSLILSFRCCDPCSSSLLLRATTTILAINLPIRVVFLLVDEEAKRCTRVNI